MGDSDDDREFRRRDKFHNERRGYEGGGGAGPPRGEWREPRPLPPPSYAYRPVCQSEFVQITRFKDPVPNLFNRFGFRLLKISFNCESN